MNTTDSAFFQSLLDEIRRHMPEVPAEVVVGMRAVTRTKGRPRSM
jgi:hypothetical protein